MHSSIDRVDRGWSPGCDFREPKAGPRQQKLRMQREFERGPCAFNHEKDAHDTASEAGQV